ncbi:MAG: amidohydrolase family protein [Lentisphaerae bacterium]|jgi:uncharacterized protein|nr:amidohydrolase family protein [Lentisphaerota bacterium]MBT4822951.1 amidohydrolase family protein [Lentisphaerota bacterium]MBT5609512.1 amidohydrolase family protein [Lentisphaerota bacterium]MBT7058490.1 amidohydrolase family protein [Lentisphaerota bacterium]MBT7845940.1 amidohydrolase family protein [Lentisphaerota bacterium]
MDSVQSLRQTILTELESIKTVDCHSHTRLESEYYANGPYDLFSLTSYFQRDLASTAGGDAYAGAKTAEERWERLRTVLAKSRNVSYWRHNLVVYRTLFGLEESELTDANWKRINDAIQQHSTNADWYARVTENVCGLETQVKNIPWFHDWEGRYFTAVLRMENALLVHQHDLRVGLEQRTGVTIHSLASAKDALRKLTQQYVERGAIGIKLAHAYRRTLHSEHVPEHRVSSVFDQALTGRSLTWTAQKELEDHMVFFLAELAQEMGLVFQIHTGVQGNWGNVPDSDPLLLIPLISAFKNVKFDLFHAGYPYSRMLGMLGKHYPNVWLNMAWMYVISMAASRRVLEEWIDLVPGYRLLGFGSDVNFPEMIYGHLAMARSCVADVLAGKVAQDFLSEEEAVSLGRRMFRDNGLELYGIPA